MPASVSGSSSPSARSAGAAASERGGRDGREQPQEREVARMRIIPPPPPFAPNMQAIPSTVATPVLRSASRNASFGHAAPAPAANRSFISGPSICVTCHRGRHPAANRAGHSSSDDDKDGARREEAAAGGGNEDETAAEDVASPTTSVTAALAGIDRKPAMIGYFGYMFGSAAINAYFGVILTEEKGFSTNAVGLLVSAIPVSQLVLLPALSFIADKYDCAARMLCVGAIGSTATVLLFTMAGSTGMTLVAYFGLIIFQTPMNPLLDKHTLFMFPAKGRTAAWGYVRSYGAYGWGAGNPVAGALVSWAGTWAIAFFQYAIGQAALLYCMYATKPYEKVDHAVSSSVKFKDVLHVLLAHPRLLLFLFGSCMMGMGYSFINNFLFIFLNELGGSKLLMGITLLVTVSTEIPIFQQSDRLHEYLTERQMISFSMLIWIVRVVGYSFLRVPWLVLLLEPLHGVSFAFSWLPGVKLISEIFPPKLASSATGILFTFVSGIGAIIGNVVAGVLYDAVGARWMFRIASIVMATALVVYQLVDRYMEKKGYPLGKPPGDEEDAPSTVVEAAVEVPAADTGSRSNAQATATPTAAAAQSVQHFSFNKWTEKHRRE